jgi:hypothetical protein
LLPAPAHSAGEGSGCVMAGPLAPVSYATIWTCRQSGVPCAASASRCWRSAWSACSGSITVRGPFASSSSTTSATPSGARSIPTSGQKARRPRRQGPPGRPQRAERRRRRPAHRPGHRPARCTSSPSGAGRRPARRRPRRLRRGLRAHRQRHPLHRQRRGPARPRGPALRRTSRRKSCVAWSSSASGAGNSAGTARASPAPAALRQTRPGTHPAIHAARTATAQITVSQTTVMMFRRHTSDSGGASSVRA